MIWAKTWKDLWEAILLLISAGILLPTRLLWPRAQPTRRVRCQGRAWENLSNNAVRVQPCRILPVLLCPMDILAAATTRVGCPSPARSPPPMGKNTWTRLFLERSSLLVLRNLPSTRVTRLALTSLYRVILTCQSYLRWAPLRSHDTSLFCLLKRTSPGQSRTDGVVRCTAQKIKHSQTPYGNRLFKVKMLYYEKKKKWDSVSVKLSFTYRPKKNKVLIIESDSLFKNEGAY